MSTLHVTNSFPLENKQYRQFFSINNIVPEPGELYTVVPMRILKDKQLCTNFINELIRVSSQHHENITSTFSDGAYNFEALYLERMLFHAALCQLASSNLFPYMVYKSKRDINGNLCNAGKDFVVYTNLPTKYSADTIIIQNYDLSFWEYFPIPEVEKAFYDNNGIDSVQTELLAYIGKAYKNIYR